MPVAVADAITIADRYLETILGADDTLTTEAPGGVWNERAEQDTEGRIVRFTYQRSRTAGTDYSLVKLNNEIMYEILTYLVRMTGDNEPFSNLYAGATRIKQLIHLQPAPPATVEVTLAGEPIGSILWGKYIGPWKELVTDGDQSWPELGGMYEIAVQPLGA